MSPQRADTLTSVLLRVCAIISATIAAFVIVFLVVEAMPALRSIGVVRMFSDRGWFPQTQSEHGAFNLGPMLVGTLAATIGAVLVAAPLGLGSAMFAQFYAPPRLARWYRRTLELLAGIPSVVYGLWGLVTLAPLVRAIAPPGTSLITGILVLALMILPTIALLSEAAMRGVPETHRRAAAALALSRWGTIAFIVVPAARRGLAVAVLLGTARAIGETMAVLMVCGNVVKVPRSLFDPVRTLTANIALELGYAAGDHRAALFASGLALMVLVALLVALAEWGRRSAVAHG